MKMAKASEADMRTALDICSALESLERHGYFPQGMPDTEDDERFDEDDAEDCKRALQYLLELSRKASLFRVVFGMTVLLDPRNKIVNPDSDVLELHPDLLPKE